jgi:hypothetical protein
MTDNQLPPPPPVDHPLRSALLKLRRAKKHAAELEQFTADYLASEPVKITYFYEGPFDPEKGPRFHLGIRGPGGDFACILGDVIHNLRATLDLMANDLVRLKGESTDDVYFPFCEHAGYIDKMITKRHFDRAGDDAVKLLKQFAPYRGGNAALRAIHDLDIQDKHQCLIPLVFGGFSPTMRFSIDDNGVASLTEVKEDLSWKTPSLAFPAGTELEGQPIFPTLHNLVELVDGVVEAFAALVAARGQP